MINLEQIKEQVAQVISYSQEIPDPEVDELINTWYANKERFITMFGGQLIYEFGEVEFHLSSTMRENKINDFIDRLVNNYQHEKLAQFVSDNRSGFFDNRVVNQYDRIPKGMKLIRAFRYFESENKALLEHI
jgi:midasin (ATPase involved in ribosome maturation)